MTLIVLAGGDKSCVWPPRPVMERIVPRAGGHANVDPRMFMTSWGRS